MEPFIGAFSWNPAADFTCASPRRIIFQSPIKAAVSTICIINMLPTFFPKKQERSLAWLAGWLVLLLGGLLPYDCRSADNTWSDPPGLINSSQQSLLEQITQLASAGQPAEAISQLNKVSDLPPALVQFGGIQAAGTQQIRLFHSLQRWCSNRLPAILNDHPELQESYHLQWNQAAAVAYDQLQKNKNPEFGFRALSQYHATTAGDSLALLLADIHLENEHCLTAAQTLETQFPELTRVYLPTLFAAAPSIYLPWHQVFDSLKDDPNAADSLAKHWLSLAAHRLASGVKILTRQLMAAAINPDLLDDQMLRRWAKHLEKFIEDPELKQQLSERIADTELWYGGNTSNSNRLPPRFALDKWPNWQIQIDRFSNSYDETPATKPPVGELQTVLPYFPKIYEGRVYLHELTRIRAFNAADGQPWPTGAPELTLYDSQISGAAYLPLGYPLQGSPRAELEIYDGCLYARMGPPVTAWANRTRATDGSSMSYLVGLDLDQQGKMLRGFPLRLSPPEFVNCELEGKPVAYRQWIITVITQRDQATIRRSLAAFDRFSGRLIWRSQVLGSGIVAGSERANIISNTQPVVAGGLVYYCSDLGSIACLNLLNGETVWLAQYQRSQQLQTEYPRPHRFRYRDGNPCLIDQGVLYCLPQDSPELIALDALSGNLIWATNETDVADATTWVGIEGSWLIINGDRLVWIDKKNGYIICGFPDPTTPGVINSLPQPRGLGRACLIKNKVYWPTMGEVLVFTGTPVKSDHPTRKIYRPELVERILASSRGLEGGHLVASNELFLMAAPGRLVCYRTEDPTR
jgi:outer membrane protein assembly factor BamB